MERILEENQTEKMTIDFDELLNLRLNSFLEAIRLFYKGPLDNRFMIYYIENYLSGLTQEPLRSVVKAAVDQLRSKYSVFGTDLPMNARDLKIYSGAFCPGNINSILEVCRGESHSKLGCERYREYCIREVVAALKNHLGTSWSLDKLRFFFQTKCISHVTLKELLAQLYGFSITNNCVYHNQIIQTVNIFFDINHLLADAGIVYDINNNGVEVFKGFLYYNLKPDNES